MTRDNTFGNTVRRRGRPRTIIYFYSYRTPWKWYEDIRYVHQDEDVREWLKRISKFKSEITKFQRARTTVFLPRTSVTRFGERTMMFNYLRTRTCGARSRTGLSEDDKLRKFQGRSGIFQGLSSECSFLIGSPLIRATLIEQPIRIKLDSEK